MQGGTASWSGAVRVRRLAQGHLDTPLGGAGDRTSELQVTIRPALPPVPHAAAATSLWLCEHQTVFVKYCSALWEEDLKVAVDQPVGLEVVIILAERVDELLRYLATAETGHMTLI